MSDVNLEDLKNLSRRIDKLQSALEQQAKKHDEEIEKIREEYVHSEDYNEFQNELKSVREFAEREAGYVD